MALRYKIGTVAKILDLESYVLRFWETEFSNLKPKRTLKGQRYYTENDLKLLQTIKTLLYEQGLTIEGARKALKAQQLLLPPPPMLEFSPPAQVKPKADNLENVNHQVKPNTNQGAIQGVHEISPAPNMASTPNQGCLADAGPDIASKLASDIASELAPDIASELAQNITPNTAQKVTLPTPNQQILAQVAEELKALQDLLRG